MWRIKPENEEKEKVMRLYVDDCRQAPAGFERARSVNDAKKKIERAERRGVPIELIDLDHDAGCYFSDGGDYINLLDWLVERKTFYPVRFHTANPVGRANMQRILNRHWPEEKEK